MSEYVDKYGLWNVKPCVGGEPSGNDGFIITAYARKVGLPVNDNALFHTMMALKTTVQTWVTYPVERLPGKETPYCSRDVFLGMADAGLTKYYLLEMMKWNFSPLPLPKLKVFVLLKQLWGLRGKHRNHFWQNEGFEQVRHVAFSVPLQDRAYYYRCSEERPPLFYRLVEYIDSKIKPKSDSSALIGWLKGTHSPTIDVFERYFGVDHPITVARKGN